MPARSRTIEPPTVDAVDDVLDALHAVLRSSFQPLADIAARHELTAEQAKLLRSLGEPRSMGSIARDRSCDASNVTGLIDRIERLGLVERTSDLIDRIERLGLVERTSDPLDRRVRLLSLTPAGRKVRASIERSLAGQPSPFAALDPTQFAQLHAILRIVAPADPA